jgi:uncharacterized protein (DUF1800 family)
MAVSDTGQTMLKARTAVLDLIRTSRPLLALTFALSLSACGGGSGGNENTQAAAPKITYPQSDAEAQRFLTQATFGPTDVAVEEVKTLGMEPWIDKQMTAVATEQAHVAFFDARNATIVAANPGNSAAGAGFNEVVQSFWKGALVEPDQLRRRVAFALSEIFVVSGADSCGADHPRGTAGFLDTLSQNAFGSYRELLEKVAMHPVMGCYLSHLKNQRENTLSGRVPDENFAREIMQLFSIGLYQLNPNGTLKTDVNGNFIDTYGQSDIAGLAKIFTGFSYDCPDWPSDSCFFWAGKDGVKYDDVWNRTMVGYPQFHSFESDKVFLGKTIKATARPNPEADLAEALDWIALTHPNVGPFIGKQLIQRLVTSNPTPEYVERVTIAFEKSGRNMGAMIKAILMDPEARNMSRALADSNNFGKVKEPILRLSALLRAVGTTSDSGQFMIDATDDANTLSQTPLKAPTVFNFFRPGYVYPGGRSAEAKLATPELQIANESSVAGYVNFMFNVLRSGVGRSQTNAQGVTRADVQLLFNLNTTTDWYALASRADSTPLIDFIDQKLMYGAMPSDLKLEIKTAVESIALSTTPTPSQVRSRLWSALLMTVASPEFLIQK